MLAAQQPCVEQLLQRAAHWGNTALQTARRRCLVCHSDAGLKAKVAADAAAANVENEAATPQRKRQQTAARVPLSPKAPLPPPR